MSRSPHVLRGVLYAVFFLSGAAALLFETLWFRQAGLAFGNSIWASSLVLSSFMAGLALGSALSARYGEHIQRPIRLYALLEIAIAVTGVGLVLLMPTLNTVLAPLFRPFVDQPWVLNPMRLAIAFALMVVPTTAMGATLPLLVKGLGVSAPTFGRALGMLYDLNTLGAVAGALGGEMLLMKALGLRGAGFAAGGMNLVAAAIAFSIDRRHSPMRRTSETLPQKQRPGAEAHRLLAAALLCGAALLALEVLWFRFMLLFTLGTSLILAIMLAIVLAGIGIGGVAAGW